MDLRFPFMVGYKKIDNRPQKRSISEKHEQMSLINLKI